MNLTNIILFLTSVYKQMIVKINVNTFNDSISNLTTIIQFLTSGYRQMIVKNECRYFQ